MESSSTEDDREKASTILYLLDRFAISDEAYHELTQTSNQLPRSYQVKRLRKEIDSTVDIRRLTGHAPGAYRPFKQFLQERLRYVVSTNLIYNYTNSNYIFLDGA